MSRTLQVGVKAIIQNEEGKVLLLRRNKKYFEEDTHKIWDIPGGRINVGEKHLLALAREIREETGLRLDEVKDIFTVQDILRNSELHVVRITFLASASGEIHLDHESDKFGWFSFEDIPLEIADPYFLDALVERGIIEQSPNSYK